jgi:hypothetical protein
MGRDSLDQTHQAERIALRNGRASTIEDGICLAGEDVVAHRLPSWLVGLLLATPLLALTAWVVSGFAASDARPLAGAAPSPRPPSPGVLPGLAAPTADLPEARFEEHVNGAADALRADGCRRLLYWRFEDPPADAELLVFRTAADARAVMETEAGPERTAGPGDEARLTEQSVYFRRGSVFVRLFLDPGAGPYGLVERANEIDRALAIGGPL